MAVQLESITCTETATSSTPVRLYLIEPGLLSNSTKS
jgi:hypothetical protein